VTATAKQAVLTTPIASSNHPTPRAGQRSHEEYGDDAALRCQDVHRLAEELQDNAASLGARTKQMRTPDARQPFAVLVPTWKSSLSS